MKKELLKYIMLTYAMFLAPLAVAILPDEGISWTRKILAVLIAPILLAVLFGPLFYWILPKLKLRYQKRKLKKKLFTTFIEKHQFKNDTNRIYGEIQDYVVFITPELDDLQQSKWVEIEILFHPKQGNQHIPQHLFTTIQNEIQLKNVSVQANSLIIKNNHALKFPKYEKVIAQITRCIQVLQKYYILPISISANNIIVSETQQHYSKLNRS